MGDDGSEERINEHELPDVPAVPTLPEAPKLRPNLPRIAIGETEQAKDYRGMGIAYTIPIMLVTPVVLFTLAGWWLDEKLHRAPVFVLSGSLLGFVVGFINMIRAANRMND